LMYLFIFEFSQVTLFIFEFSEVDIEGECFETFLISLELLNYRGFDVNLGRLDFWKPRVSENSEV
jgi:hypothetical protein